MSMDVFIIAPLCIIYTILHHHTHSYIHLCPFTNPYFNPHCHIYALKTTLTLPHMPLRSTLPLTLTLHMHAVLYFCSHSSHSLTTPPIQWHITCIPHLHHPSSTHSCIISSSKQQKQQKQLYEHLQHLATALSCLHHHTHIQLTSPSHPACKTVQISPLSSCIPCISATLTLPHMPLRATLPLTLTLHIHAVLYFCSHSSHILLHHPCNDASHIHSHIYTIHQALSHASWAPASNKSSHTSTFTPLQQLYLTCTIIHTYNSPHHHIHHIQHATLYRSLHSAHASHAYQKPSLFHVCPSGQPYR
jgi:hypothetical protein